MHRKHIERIIKEGTIAQMVELKDLFICAIDTIKKLDEGKYEWFECKLHKILYGYHMGEDTAKEWVMSMVNKDGTYGAH